MIAPYCMLGIVISFLLILFYVILPKAEVEKSNGAKEIERWHFLVFPDHILEYSKFEGKYKICH